MTKQNAIFSNQQTNKPTRTNSDQQLPTENKSIKNKIVLIIS